MRASGMTPEDTGMRVEEVDALQLRSRGVERRGSRYRAALLCRGTRVSKSFDTPEEAVAWREAERRRIASLDDRRMAVAAGKLLSIVPRRVLDAMASIEYSESEIGAGSIQAQTSAVYFLLLAGRVVYVGKSISLLSRIARHQRDRDKEFDSFNFIPCPPERLDELEAKYILAFMPWRNRAL